MGQCCGRGDVILNEGENFIQELINSLKIRNETYPNIKKCFSNCIEKDLSQDGDFLRERILISEKGFDFFIDSYFYWSDPSENSNIEFHKSLAPTYDEIIIIDKFEYSFHQYSLALYKSLDKNVILYNLLSEHSFQPVTLKLFEEFLIDYLRINLISFTKKINKQLRIIKYNTIINGFIINQNLIDKCLDLEKNIFNEDNLRKVFNRISNSIRKIVGFNDKNLKDASEVIITENTLKNLTEFYPHLYDCTILRQYFYISFAERL